jgi:hypothetical protein
VYAESWDADGRLWKFSHATMDFIPDLPAMILGSQITYDLLGGGYALAFTFNGEPTQFRPTPPHKATDFSPETLAAEGVR